MGTNLAGDEARESTKSSIEVSTGGRVPGVLVPGCPRGDSVPSPTPGASGSLRKVSFVVGVLIELGIVLVSCGVCDGKVGPIFGGAGELGKGGNLLCRGLS